MDNWKFPDYLQAFEAEVVVCGVGKNWLGKSQLVSVRDGRLAKKRFGRLVGSELECTVSFAIDYYGHLKKTTGLLDSIQEVEGQVKRFETSVVHFASIRIETVAELAPELVAQFPRFKKELLKERGFAK